MKYHYTIKNGVTTIDTGDAVGGRKAVSGHTGVVWLKHLKKAGKKDRIKAINR